MRPGWREGLVKTCAAGIPPPSRSRHRAARRVCTCGLCGLINRGGRSGAQESCGLLAQLTAAEWYLGPAGADVFAFTDEQTARGAGAIGFKIVTGCGGCAFTGGQGKLTAGGRIELVADGKGLNVTHAGTITSGEGGQCRIDWRSHTNKWGEFCQGKLCQGDPPAPPRPAACEKMLTAGGVSVHHNLGVARPLLCAMVPAAVQSPPLVAAAIWSKRFVLQTRSSGSRMWIGRRL